MKLEHLVNNLEKLNSPYSISESAAEDHMARIEEKLSVKLPTQVKIFYQHCDGLAVENPPFQILPLAQLSFIAPDLLHFATFDNQHKVCFDTSHLNPAEQWFILFADNGNRITFTMASFWSNKIWKWLERRHAIWLE